MLSKDQEAQIKSQLMEQINSNFPEDQKEAALSQIQNLQGEAFEQFLKENKLINPEGDAESQQCIFCSIIEGKMPTNKFAENSHAIATLDINPISKGHSIIIPKIHSTDAPKEAFNLAKIIEQKIMQEFGPKKVDISTVKIFDHEIINILPIYENETINSEKKKATQAELQAIQKQLTIAGEVKKEDSIVKEETPRPEIIISDKIHWLPIRIP